jgi:hypothetical protein
MRLRVGDALLVVSTKTGADMGHDRMVTRLYSLRKPAPNLAAFGRAGEGHTGQLALIFIDIPQRKGTNRPCPLGLFADPELRRIVAAAAAHSRQNKTFKAQVREAMGENSE